MSFLIDNALAQLKLDDEIAYLKTLAKLADHWEELNQALPGNTALEDIIDLVVNFDQVKASIAPIIEEAGVDIDQLTAIIGRIRETYDGAVPEKAQLLLRRMSDFADLDDEVILQWKFLALEGSRGAAAAGNKLTFDLGASANAKLEIEPGDQPERVSEEILLRLALNGDIGGNLKLGAKNSWGPINAELGAERSGSLTYWIGVPKASDDRLLEAVAEGLENLANPFDLKSIDAATQDDLDRLELTSNIEINQNLTVKFNIAPTMNVPRVIQNEIAFSAAATRSRKLNIEAYRDDDDLCVRLVRSKVRSAESNAQWSFSIDVSDIASKVKDHVDTLSDELRAFKREYGDLLSPGTWLKKNAAELLDDFAKKVGGTRNLASAEIADLKDQVARELDSGKALLTSEINGLAAPILEELKKHAPSAFHDKIDAPLKKLIERLQERIDTEIGERVDTRLGQSDATVKKFFKRIDKLNELVEAKVDDAATRADNATARVREILGKLEGVVARLTKILEKAATAKLQVRLWHEESIRSGREAEATLRFTAVNTDTARVYTQLLRGEVSALARLFKRRVPGIEIDDGEFTEFLERSVKDGFVISLLGFEAGQTDLFSEKSVITIDKNGNVMVHASAASAKTIRSPWAAQEVAFASQFELWSASQSGSGSLTISATQEDKNLKVKELVDLLDDLVRNGLIHPQVLENAKTTLNERVESGKKLRATVDLRLAMLDDDVDKLLAAGDPDANDRDIIRRVLDVLGDSGAFSPDTIHRAARAALRTHMPRTLRTSLKDRPIEEVFEHFQPVPTGRSSASWRAFARLEFAQTHNATTSTVSGSDPRRIREAQQIHRLVKGYGVLLKTLNRMAKMNPRAASVKKIRAEHEVVGLCIRPWLRVSRAFITHPQDELHEATLAFLLLLASDAGLPIDDESESAVSVAITFAGDDAPHLIS